MEPKLFRKAWIFLAMVIILSAPAVSLAEFYSYRDVDGILRFTDHLVETAADQNTGIRRHLESREFPDTAASSEPQASPHTPSTVVSDKIVLETHAYTTHKHLNRRKAGLESEYEELVAAQQKLKQEAEIADTLSELRVYNQKATQLNRKIHNFESRRRAYETAVQEFIRGN